MNKTEIIDENMKTLYSLVKDRKDLMNYDSAIFPHIQNIMKIDHERGERIFNNLVKVIYQLGGSFRIDKRYKKSYAFYESMSNSITLTGKWPVTVFDKISFLIHEIGHMLTISEINQNINVKMKDSREVVAEAICYLVVQHFGLYNKGSVFYIKIWGRGKEKKYLEIFSKLISEVANKILTTYSTVAYN